MVARIIQVIVQDNDPYIGILYDGRLYLLDNRSFTNVLFRKRLYHGWVGYVPPNYELEVEPEISKRFLVYRLKSNLYILDKEDVEEPEIHGLDLWYK